MLFPLIRSFSVLSARFAELKYAASPVTWGFCNGLAVVLYEHSLVARLGHGILSQDLSFSGSDLTTESIRQ